MELARREALKIVLFSPTVTVIVGKVDGAKSFTINRRLLCQQSKYFDRAFNSSFFEEGKTGLCTLHDIPAAHFRIFTSWLYGGGVVYLSEVDGEDMPDIDIGESDAMDPEAGEDAPGETQEDHSEAATIDNDECKNSSASIEGAMTENDGDLDDSGVTTTDESAQRENPLTWPWKLLIDLYIFGDRFDCRQFRMDIIDIMLAKSEGEGVFSNLLLQIPHALANVPQSSPLRLFLMHTVAFDFALSSPDEVYMILPKDFLIGVMKICSQRMPKRLCDSCYGYAKKYCDLSQCTIHDYLEGKDQSPAEVNICVYHEHITTGEGIACQARYKAWVQSKMVVIKPSEVTPTLKSS